MRCTFCATGKGGFARNLRAHEIVDQVLTVQERFGTRVSNVGASPLLEKRFSGGTLDALSAMDNQRPSHCLSSDRSVLSRELQGENSNALNANIRLSLLWIPCRAVFMGMGEPLLNLRAVTAAARFINGDLGIGARHITVSTVGVPNAIGMLARDLKQHSLQITLAVSIHAPSQAVRQRIIPR